MKFNLYYLFVFLYFITSPIFSQDIWINEFSYNCSDSSEGVPEGDEFVEIVAPVGRDMSQYALIFYYYLDNDDFYTYSYTQLAGVVSSVNQNAGKGFFIVQTDLSHRLEYYAPIPDGITVFTFNTNGQGIINSQGGILLIDTESGEVIHGVGYEIPIGLQIPSIVRNKLEGIEFDWAQSDFALSLSIVDGISLPVIDDETSAPNGSISMIGIGFSHLWATTAGEAPSISTPGSLNYSQGALPVELSSFSATVLTNGVKLNWRTETETNNFGFDIERRINSGDWTTLTFVNGNGNSNSPEEYSFIDNSAKVGRYSYRLKQIDNDGTYSYSKIVDVDLTKQLEYNLTQNFPNPFNPTTSISFSIPKSGVVKLTVYNLLGQEIKTLVNGFKEAGVHNVNFNAKDLNSGIYIYKIETTDYIQTRKMTLVK